MTTADYARARRLLDAARSRPCRPIRQIGACGMASRLPHRPSDGARSSDRGPAAVDESGGDDLRPARALFPDEQITVDGLQALSDAALRGVGLSSQKLAYLRDLSARIADGRLLLDELDELPDEQVIERLTAVKGFGRWTAEMFLMFRLQRPDVLPVGDLGIVHGRPADLSAAAAAEAEAADQDRRGMAAVSVHCVLVSVGEPENSGHEARGSGLEPNYVFAHKRTKPATIAIRVPRSLNRVSRQLKTGGAGFPLGCGGRGIHRGTVLM